MEKEIIIEIKRLNEEIRGIIKQQTDSDKTIILQDDFIFDQMRHNFSLDIIEKALLNGLHLEDKHLYPEDPDKKHKGKNYYCIHRHKDYTFFVKYMLISYLKRPRCLVLFHISPLHYGSKEQRRYKEIAKLLEDPSLKDT